MAQQRRKNAASNSTDTLTDVKVGVYNIFITTNAELADNFSKYSSYSILKSDLDRSQHDTVRALGKDSFGDKNRHRINSSDKRASCLLTSDINLIEFTHEFNFSEGKSTAPIMRLKCLESGLEVLKKFYYLQLGERMSEIKYRKNELLEQSKNLDKAADALHDPDYFTDNRSRQERFDALSLAEREAEDYIKNNVNGQRVFIAYGIGDDLKYWGGPYSSILGELEHSNDGKTETITYHFTPDHISRQFDENPKDIGSDTINFKTISLPISAYRSDKNENKELVKFAGFTPSMHDNVVKLISNYLYQLGIKNHLIVLPNLDYLLSPLAANVLQHHSQLTKDGEATNPWAEHMNSLLTSINDDSIKSNVTHATTLLKSIVYQNQRIFGLETSKITLGHEAMERRGLAEGTVKSVIGMQKDYIHKIGLRANVPHSESSEVDPRMVKGMEENASDQSTREDDPVDSGPLFGVSTFVNYRPSEAKKLRLELALQKAELRELRRLTIHDPFSSSKLSDTADYILSLELPFEADADAIGAKRPELLKDNNFIGHVEKFLQTIVNKNGGFVGRLTSFWENDVGMLNLLKSKFGSGTFVGYRDNIKRKRAASILDNANLTGSNLDISDDSFFIFGDSDLIRDFLYGEITHKLAFNPESRSAVSQLQRGIPVSLEGVSNPDGYFLDPFWGRLRGDLQEILYSTASVKQIADSSVGSGNQTKAQRSEYRSSIRGTYFAKAQKIASKAKEFTPFGYFNDVNIAKAQITRMLPDEFAFLNKDENSHAIDDIYELSIPFFMANTKSSNVMSYTFDADNFIFTQFLGSIREIYYNVAYRYVKLGQTNPVQRGHMSSDAVFEKIYSILDQVRKRGGSYGAAYSKIGLSTPALSLTNLSTDLTDIMLQETVGLNRKVRKNYGADTLAICSLFISLFESQFKGFIKTLPMYNLSTQSTILKPVIVSLKTTPGINIKRQNDMSTTDFFSGLYKILGFKHTITNKKGESEFALIKDVHSTLSDERE